MPFKRHNPGCPCCDEISSSSSSSSVSSSSVSSISSSSSSSSESAPRVFDPCDPDDDSTLFLKIECSGFEEEFSDMHPNCTFQNQFPDRSNFNGTYLIPFTKVPGNPPTFTPPPSQTLAPKFTRLALNSSGVITSTTEDWGTISIFSSTSLVSVNAAGRFGVGFGAEVTLSLPVCSTLSSLTQTASKQSSGFDTRPTACGRLPGDFREATGLLTVSIVAGPIP
jgi:hypothetical protein